MRLETVASVNCAIVRSPLVSDAAHSSNITNLSSISYKVTRLFLQVDLTPQKVTTDYWILTVSEQVNYFTIALIWLADNYIHTWHKRNPFAVWHLRGVIGMGTRTWKKSHNSNPIRTWSGNCDPRSQIWMKLESNHSAGRPEVQISGGKFKLEAENRRTWAGNSAMLHSNYWHEVIVRPEASFWSTS